MRPVRDRRRHERFPGWLAASLVVGLPASPTVIPVRVGDLSLGGAAVVAPSRPDFAAGDAWLRIPWAGLAAVVPVRLVSEAPDRLGILLHLEFLPLTDQRQQLLLTELLGALADAFKDGQRRLVTRPDSSGLGTNW